MMSCSETCSDSTNFAFAFDNIYFSDWILRIEIVPDLDDDHADTELLRVKNIHLNSAILAKKSPFFYKLFSNAKKVSSEQRHEIIIRIHTFEEAAFIDLLKFMYSEKLVKSKSPSALLELLMTANVFEVVSCIRYCSRVLSTTPMTCQSASQYLEFSSRVSRADIVKPLIEAAKKTIISQIAQNDLTTTNSLYDQEVVMNLSLAGIKIVFGSDELQIATEDDVYDILLEWANKRYPDSNQRKEIISNHLFRLIRFPLMTCKKLKKVLECVEFDSNLVSKTVLNALFIKADPNSSNVVHRAYKYRPVKVVEFELPQQHTVVYLDLKREECASLFPNKKVYSQAFDLDEQSFVLYAQCCEAIQTNSHTFGLFLRGDGGETSVEVKYEFAVRLGSRCEYLTMRAGKHKLARGRDSRIGCRNVLCIPWNKIMDEESPFFINGILYLRAVFTMIRQ